MMQAVKLYGTVSLSLADGYVYTVIISEEVNKTKRASSQIHTASGPVSRRINTRWVSAIPVKYKEEAWSERRRNDKG